MSTITVDEALSRIGEIDREIRSRGVSATVGTIVFGQLLFASFVFGHGRGPMPMPTAEVLLGMLGALTLSLLVAPYAVRRRKKQSARFGGTATEGRHQRRVLAYDDHFLLAGEVILYDMVERFAVDGERLTFRYFDPRHEGPVLRELEGAPALTERLARRFEAAGAKADSPLPTLEPIQ